MGRLIINNISSHSDIDALHYVKDVMSEGRNSGLSDAGYCYATVYKDGTRVFCKKNRSSDTITVMDKQS